MLFRSQQTEGDLSDILDHFLLSFEQQVASSANSVLNGNIQTDCSHTDRPPEPYAAMTNDSGAQTQTRPAEHGAQTSSVFELTHAVGSRHSAGHTAHQQHTHTQYGEEPDPVRHYPLTHTTPKPPSSAPLSQPAKAVPSTGQPSPIRMEERLVEEGRRMTRSQMREGIRTSEEAKGVKRFPPALEQTQRQQSEEESTKTPHSQSQPTKPHPDQTQPPKPPTNKRRIPVNTHQGKATFRIGTFLWNLLISILIFVLKKKKLYILRLFCQLSFLDCNFSDLAI